MNESHGSDTTGSNDVPGEVDVIVVGAGTAGCVLARRLVDAGYSVLLVEAGTDGRANGAITDPARMHELWDTPVDWGFRTTPQPHAHDRRLHLPRGRVIGGSHALNAMIWVRGHRVDYDTWSYLGNRRWAWERVEPVFESIENLDGAGPGLQHVLIDYEPDPAHRSIVDAATECGMPLDANYNDGHPDGVSFAQFTIHDGRRFMTADGYLEEVRNHPRLNIVAGVAVTRVLFDGARCVGIEYQRGATRTAVHARDRVVLCAGAIGTPTLLQRSGVGDPGLLAAHDIDIISPLQAVGQNLQDHWLVPVILSTSRTVGAPSGLPTTQSHLFARSSVDLATPDLQPIFFSAPLLADWMIGPSDGISLMAGLVRPASRGTVRIAGPDPARAPVIDPQVLSADQDVTALVAAVRLCREIARQPALRDYWGASETYPGTLAGSTELLRDYIRESVVTYHHQAGTCAMGPPGTAVVDQALSVYGVDGLMIADASVMPTITTGNTNAPVVMIAERAAAEITSGILSAA